MEILTKSQIQSRLENVYSNEAERSRQAIEELKRYGEQLLAEDRYEDYQNLVNWSAGIIAQKGIDVNPTERVVIEGRPVEGSIDPRPIALMKMFEAQAKEKLGEKTDHAREVRLTREIVEKTASVLSRQRAIMEKVGKDPSSIAGFLAAIDRNNDATRASIEIEERKLTHYREYFTDNDALTVINPNADEYKDSLFDQVTRADMQVQLLADLKRTIELLKENEENRANYQRQVDEGDEDARANVEACKRKEAELKEKIAKRGPDGRETGLIQRLSDYGLSSTYIADIDIDRMESYDEKTRRIDALTQNVKQDRMEAYKRMAKEVRTTLEAKDVVDANSKYAGKKDKLMADCQFILTDGRASKDGDEYEDSGEGEMTVEERAAELEKAMASVKGYVKFVRDEIGLIEEKIQEGNDTIEFRNQTKSDLERQREESETFKRQADELRGRNATDAERNAWLNESYTVGEGDAARSTTRKAEIEARARREAEHELANRGTGFWSRMWDNIKFAFKNGFRSRDRMIAERAESLRVEKENDYVARRHAEHADEVENQSKAYDRTVNAIESKSREARNDESLHKAAHNAAANITDQEGRNGGPNKDRRIDRAETQTAKNLSNMGYDIALQKWRNGDMSQAEFDRILKEHLDTTTAQKSRYANPDETKGYTQTPEYRNAPTRGDRE